MNINSIKLRSFNAGCAHEIVLPNGKVILIDPFFRRQEESGYSKDDVTGADYILITHTHFDDELDLGYFIKKFNSIVFVGAFSATSLLKYHEIPYDNLVPVIPDQEYSLEDFKLNIIQSKHNPTGKITYDSKRDITMKEFGLLGHKECDDWGYIESIDYMVTTKNNFRFLTASGQNIWSDIFNLCKDKAPNLLLRQAGVRKNGTDLFGDGQVSPKELAKLFVKYGAQIIMPFHMDVIYMRWGIEKTEEYFKNVKEEVSNLSPGSLLVLPKAWKWYEIGVSVKEG